MRKQRDVRKSYRARYNQMKSHVKDLALILETDPDSLTGEEIGQLRMIAEDTVQCAHEFSAYWNVVNT